MDLCIDQGNTSTKLAWYHNRELLRTDILDDDSLLNSLEVGLREMQPTRCLVSSVRANSDEIEKLISSFCNYKVMHAGLKMPFHIAYTTPHTIGSDRLANAAALYRRFPTSPSMVIDFGTCNTYSIMENGHFIGGAISPGMEMRLNALHHFTGKLPLVTLKSELPEIIGRSTNDSILSGVMCATIAETDGMIKNYCSQIPGLTVIITGGNLGFFEKHLKSPIFAVPFLTLEGLHEILLFNDI